MRTANAKRKVVVIGSVSDTPKSFYHRYRAVIELALGVADKIIFVGDHARSALTARPCPKGDSVMAFDTLYQLNSFLGDYLETGDLVLLKGSIITDHLDRIVLSRTNDIACWQERCGKQRFCSDCRNRHNSFVPVS